MNASIDLRHSWRQPLRRLERWYECVISAESPDCFGRVYRNSHVAVSAGKTESAPDSCPAAFVQLATVAIRHLEPVVDQFVGRFVRRRAVGRCWRGGRVAGDG